MSRRTAIWIVSIGLCLFTGLVGLVAFFYQPVRAFLVESEVHDTFYPLASALFRYQDEQGHPARSLGSLVPRYLDTIHTCPHADAPIYRVSPDGAAWELVIYRRALPQRRLYLCRSTLTYTPEETRRMILQYHLVWAVFPADP